MPNTISFTRLARIRNLPAILAGKAADPDGYREAFTAAFTFKLIDQIHTAFEIKTLGGTDDLGHSFEPLSARRLAQKSSAKFLRRYPNSIPNAVVRVTRRLLDSYAAGFYSDKRYLPSKNQVVELRDNLIKIYSKVPYAIYQANKRPFWPDDISPWINTAISFALEALIDKLETMQ